MAITSTLLLRLALLAGTLSSALTLAQPLPEGVAAALASAHIPPDAVSLLVVDADGRSPPRLSYRADVAMHPASTMKLVTTYAALDLLGPAYTWRTPVWLDGRIRQGKKGGMLQGNLVLQGQGDPTLVLERLWLLLHRVQGLGVQTIDGDIVLDRHAFDLPPVDPADFDGEPLRPYNAAPDALLLNFKSLVMTFTPDLASAVARVQYDPPLWGVGRPATVPLNRNRSMTCGDYRAGLKADLSDPQRIRFAGSYAADCGEKVWPVAYADPASYNARAIEGLWRSMGGGLTGTVREGSAPATPATFAMTSPPLGEVIRDINKFSNNVMAQQLFLTLAGAPTDATRMTANSGSGDVPAAAPPLPATLDAGRATLHRWWLQRIGPLDAPVIDNGSGLSREARISAQALARLLQAAYASPYMPELMASLPIVGVDGTLKRSHAPHASAHLKTGSLRDVAARAGYVHTADGKLLCMVALVNHANAAAARPALDALLDWALHDTTREQGSGKPGQWQPSPG